MILLVQLHTPTRLRTAEILRTAGYHVEEASCGAEALVLFAAKGFDLVITDVLLPTIGGVDVAARIRCVKPDIPIILTGFLPPIHADAILRQPICFVFQPIDQHELLLSVDRLLPQRVFKHEYTPSINSSRLVNCSIVRLRTVPQRG